MPDAVVSRFVILGWARSGTTALVSYLDSHPQIACYHELFNDRHLVEPALPPVELVNHVFSTGVVIRDLGGLTEPPGQPGPILNRPHGGQCLSVGFKLLVNQAYAMPAVCREIARQPDVGVILMHRTNALRKLVSLRLAMRTGQWSSRATATSDATVRISIRELIRSVESDEVIRQHVLNFVEVAGNPTFELTYEDLFRDPDARLRELQRWLGVDAQPLATEFKRLNTRPLRAVIENYAAFADQVRSAGLSRFLDD